MSRKNGANQKLGRNGFRGSANTCVGEHKRKLFVEKKYKKIAFSLSIADVCRLSKSSSGRYFLYQN